MSPRTRNTPPTGTTATRRGRAPITPAPAAAAGETAAPHYGKSVIENVLESLTPTEKARLIGEFETGIRALAPEFPSPADFELFMELTELRQQLRPQPTPAERLVKLERALEDAKEATEPDVHIEALKRIIAHALAGIQEAKAIEATLPDEQQQVRR